MVVAFAAHAVVTGRIAPGELLVLVTYVAAAYAPLEALSNSVTVLQDQCVALEHAIELLDAPVAVSDRPNAARSDVPGRDLFRDVSFGYAARSDTFTTSISMSGPARCWRSWAPLGPARPRSSTCCPDSTIPCMAA